MARLCFCNSTIAWGGGERWHLEAALDMARRGHEVTLICRPDGALCEHALPSAGPVGAGSVTVKPFAIGRLSFLNPLLRRRLTNFFRSRDIEALVMNLPADLKAVGPAAKDAGTARIIYRRGSALPVKNSALNRRLYSTVIDRVIVNSRATGELIPHSLITPDRVTLLPNGIDIAAFDAALARDSAEPAGRALEDWVAAARRQGDPLILGNAGRLNRQKAQHLFVLLGKAMEDLGRDVRLIVAGEGERRAELEELARRQGIHERVFFAGFLKDLSPFWRSLDLFILTSLWEGFGYVVLEAMLAGVPPVAFAVSNIPDLVRHGENGLLFPLPQEPEAVVPATLADLRAVAQGILADAGTSEQRHALCRRSRILAERFDQKKAMDTLEQLLLGRE